MSIDALQSKIRKMKNPTMVCICPYYDQIPAYLRENARAEFGDTLRAAAEACLAFSCGILDALADIVPAVSVETACFTALGADGTTAMQQVLNYATQKGYYVLLDAMRCDIAPNAELLAQSCFGLIQVGDYGYRPYVCDGVLLSSYLGSDAVKPFTRFCAEGRNVFLLAHSSNKSAREVQDLLSGDRVVYQVMADLAMRWSTAIRRSALLSARTTCRCCKASAGAMTGCSCWFPASVHRAQVRRMCSTPLTAWATARSSWPDAAFCTPI